jgi:hypothetical protein
MYVIAAPLQRAAITHFNKKHLSRALAELLLSLQWSQVSLISSRRSPHLRPAGTYFSSFSFNQLFYNGSIINSGCEIKNDKNTLRLGQINHLGERFLRNAENLINARAYIYNSTKGVFYACPL